MEKVNINGLDLWQFENLLKESGVSHFVTDRNSYSNDNEFTLSYSSSPDKDFVKNNRNLLATAIGIPLSQIYFPSQVHKTRIINVSRTTPKEELLETDALITNEKNICIAVMSADCVPILLYDKKNQAIGAVHSGWRGTVAKIIEKTLHEMHYVFGTIGENIIAAIGPSVCQDSYEVGTEVVMEFNNVFGKEMGLMLPQVDGKAKLDLWKANKIQLLTFGVKESNIEISNLCSVKNNSNFFSARKGDTGRFAAGIMLI